MIRFKPFYHRLLFCVIFLSALALRLYALLAIENTPYFSFLLPDERYYHNWAVDIVNGAPQAGAYEYAPLPAYTIALLYKLSTVDVYVVRIFNIVCNLAGCLLVYLICRKVVGKNWALLGLLLAAISTELVLYSVVPLKTSMAFFLLSLLTYFFLLQTEKTTAFLLFLSGGILGLLIMVRPNALILLPFIPLLLFHIKRNKKLFQTLVGNYFFYTAGFVIAIAPFTLLNIQSSGDHSFLPVQSGFLFYCTNTVENPTPFYKPVPFASSLPEEQGTHFQIEASIRLKERVSPRTASQFWQMEVLHEAQREPERILTKLKNKIGILFSFSENSDHYSTHVVSELSPFFTHLHLKMWLFILFGYCGLLFSFKEDRVLRCLSCIVLLYLATLAIYSTGNRFFLPLLTLLIPFSVWTSKKIFNSLRYKKYSALGIIILSLAALFYLGNLPITGAGDMSKHYNNLAFIHFQKNDINKALTYWHKSYDRKEAYSDIAALFIAGQEYNSHGPERAIQRLTGISDSSFMASAKYASLGDIYNHHNKSQKALSAYQRSLSYNQGQTRVREVSISLLSRLSPSQAAEMQEELDWILTFYE